MTNGNTTLSSPAQKAVERIRTLRAITEKTGFQTRDEQIRLLLALEDADVLAVIDAVGMKLAGGGR